MNKTQSRRSAIGVARVETKKWRECTADDALDVLDDMCRKEPDLIGCIWYAENYDNENQLRLFKREWDERAAAA